ncbi:hypothetical protein SAMN02799616_01788 [Paenibacillus sp. UNC499MF]|nr:hypothetical protein SAMN02799616_01788 [Paenibacillus sp. UNC499MF]
MGFTEFGPPDVLGTAGNRSAAGKRGRSESARQGGGRSAERLAEPVELYTRGQLAIHVGPTFPLSRAA